MSTTWKTVSLVAVCALSGVAVGCGGGASSSAQETTPAPDTTQQQSAANSGGEAEAYPMPLPNFLGAVTREVLPDLCSDASPLRTCYPSIDAELCANAFATAMMLCGENMQSTLPAEVTEENADPVATAVATCARMAYQAGLEQAGVVRATDCPLAR
ncbi:MAG: hypothetical protein J0L92_13595 [Deltaproteobacteria bacterium]|nr:hypothetical protein [Deltaproteobacteria bacterium]